MRVGPHFLLLFLALPAVIRSARPQRGELLDHNSTGDIEKPSHIEGNRKAKFTRIFELAHTRPYQQFEKTVSLRAGPSGIEVDPTAHKILSVKEDSPAFHAGVHPGAYIMELEDQQVEGSDELQQRWRELEAGERPYEIHISHHRYLSWYRQGLIGLELLAIPVLVFYSLLYGVLRGKLASTLATPVSLFCFVVFFAGDLASHLQFWDLEGRVGRMAILASPLPIVGGVLGITRSLALRMYDEPLPSQTMSAMRWESLGLFMATLFILCTRPVRTFKEVLYSGVWNYLILVLNEVYMDIWWLYVSQFSVCLLRVATVVADKLDPVQQALPCRADEFAERARRPLAKILDELEPQLGRLGLPMVMVLVELPVRFMKVWIRIMEPTKKSTSAMWLMNTFSLCLEFGLLLYVLLRAPLKISSTRKKLRTNLARMRKSDEQAHGVVAEVETMVAQANDGHGFGISADRIIVIDSDFLLKLSLLSIVGFVLFQTVFKVESDQDGSHADAMLMARRIARNLSDVHAWVASKTETGGGH